MNTLTNFFSQTPATDLNSCDLEQVHLLGTIQHEGAMLVVRQDTQQVVAISDNVVDILGCESSLYEDTSLQQMHQELSAILNGLEADQEGVHNVLDCSLSHDSQHFEAIAHGHLGNWVIDFLPAGNSLDTLTMRQQLRAMTRESGRILSSETVDDAQQIACDAVRQITSFARVQIFQFLPDWSGKVIADSRAEHMSSFVGLHFPAADIPKQARALMQLVPYRGVFSVNDETFNLQQNPLFVEESVDLTYALTRSCSVMHTAYLRNMGVQSTFSVSLLKGGDLWGFISCHHDEASVLPFDVWSLLRELGTALMSRISNETSLSTSRKVLELRKIEGEFATTFRENGELSETILKFSPVLMDFMNADGFAFQFDGRVNLFGQAPPEKFVSKFIDWAQRHADVSGQYQSTSLHKEWPEAKQHIDTACGVLLQPVSSTRICQIIWFRKPLSESVIWAGEPTDKSKPSEQGETASLLPRNSFETWIAQHNDFSLAWTDAELSVAREILRELLDVIASGLKLAEENTRLVLSEENTKLKSFAVSAAAHDIRGPLRRIELALQFMEEDDFEPEAIRQGHGIASKSARVLKNVSAGILDFMSVPDKAQAFSAVRLSDVFIDVDVVLSADSQNEDVVLTVDTQHSVVGEPSLLTSLFLNLVNNSVKYSKPGQVAEVQVRSMLIYDDWIEIMVTDNGIGIPAEYADRIFYPSERLGLKDNVEGSGMGLAICSRIINIHSGSIGVDKNYTDGSRIIVRLPQGQ